MNLDVKNVVKKLSKLEKALKNKVETGTLVTEIKRFTDGQVKTLRQKVKSSKDMKKLVAVVDQRKKQVEKIAANLPKEMKSLRTYVQKQRKELEKLGNELIKQARSGKLNAQKIRSAIRATRAKTATTAKKATTKTSRKATTKKRSTKKATTRKAK